jgi:hypothetical protein
MYLGRYNGRRNGNGKLPRVRPKPNIQAEQVQVIVIYNSDHCEARIQTVPIRRPKPRTIFAGSVIELSHRVADTYLDWGYPESVRSIKAQLGGPR